MTVGPALQFLAETVLAKARHLQTADGRLSAVSMTPERAGTLASDIDLAERTDAFVARFGRLQDTLTDKLLPALLDWLSEPVAAAIDNLNRAERLGWIMSVEDWTEVRRLRNCMIHECVRDPAELAFAPLRAAHAAVPLLTNAAKATAARVAAGAQDLRRWQADRTPVHRARRATASASWPSPRHLRHDDAGHHAPGGAGVLAVGAPSRCGWARRLPRPGW